jgi:hypothetical protein
MELVPMGLEIERTADIHYGHSCGLTEDFLEAKPEALVAVGRGGFSWFG